MRASIGLAIAAAFLSVASIDARADAKAAQYRCDRTVKAETFSFVRVAYPDLGEAVPATGVTIGFVVPHDDIDFMIYDGDGKTIVASIVPMRDQTSSHGTYYHVDVPSLQPNHIYFARTSVSDVHGATCSPFAPLDVGRIVTAPNSP